MRSGYFRAGIWLTIGSAVANGLIMLVMFLPLIGVIQNLTSNAGTGGSLPKYIAWFSLLAGIALAVSVMSVVLNLKGLVKDNSRRVWWIVLLVLSFMLLILASGMMLAGPHFMDLYKDLLQNKSSGG